VPWHLSSISLHSFLFTKSDIKTTVIPIVNTHFLPVTRAARADRQSNRRCLQQRQHSLGLVAPLPRCSLIWLHLLQLDVSNPDALSRGRRHEQMRPASPSGRISMRNALILRWLLVPCVVDCPHYTAARCSGPVSSLHLSLLCIMRVQYIGDNGSLGMCSSPPDTWHSELGTTLIAAKGMSLISTLPHIRSLHPAA